LNKEQEKILEEYAILLNIVERSLYAEVTKGHSSASCKNQFLKKFNITARQFNACRVSLEGKITACEESQKRTLVDLKQRIDTIDKQIKHLERKPSKLFELHHKKRRRDILSHRIASIEKDKRQKRSRICFGGKKLFNAQFYLEKYGFNSHQEWKNVWKEKRNSEFFVLGSKDETSGNQTCTASLQSNGKICLRLRLPKALEQKHSKYMEIRDVVFQYGQQTILSALNNPDGQAICYRFKKDKKSWKIFATTHLKKPPIESLEKNGVIGIDLNADHIAYIETDRFGNPITKKTISWVSYGKTKHQLKALTGEICRDIINHAKEVKKPLVIEKLDFQNKKMKLQNESPKFARLLSSFAYGMFFKFLMAKAFKEGIEIHQVNPAFTSIIGRINYAKRYGLSNHLAAALCIARRYQKFSESPCSSIGNIPDGKGSHVAFVLPVRNRTKHVWHFWRQVKKKLTTVLAAHYQAIRKRSSSPPSPVLATG
jgi:IS605 OrfB family transposase